MGFRASWLPYLGLPLNGGPGVHRRVWCTSRGTATTLSGGGSPGLPYPRASLRYEEKGPTPSTKHQACAATLQDAGPWFEKRSGHAQGTQAYLACRRFIACTLLFASSLRCRTAQIEKVVS